MLQPDASTASGSGDHCEHLLTGSHVRACIKAAGFVQLSETGSRTHFAADVQSSCLKTDARWSTKPTQFELCSTAGSSKVCFSSSATDLASQRHMSFRQKHQIVLNASKVGEAGHLHQSTAEDTEPCVVLQLAS